MKKGIITFIITLGIFISFLSYWNSDSVKLTRLEKQYASGNINTRGKAIRVIGHISWREDIRDKALDVLFQAANDNDYWIRAEAINALEEYDDPGVLKLAERLLISDNPSERIGGVCIIWENGTTEYIDKIIILLEQDEDQGVRANCAGALGDIGDERAILPLINMLDKNDDVAHNAWVSLRAITGQDFGPNKNKSNILYGSNIWVEWWNREGKNFNAIEHEIKKLEQSTKPIDRIAAINRLWRLKATKAISLLKENLKTEKKDYVKRHIEKALSKLKKQNDKKEKGT